MPGPAWTAVLPSVLLRIAAMTGTGHHTHLFVEMGNLVNFFFFLNCDLLNPCLQSSWDYTGLSYFSLFLKENAFAYVF
jgi:hypothetical protein